MDTHVNLRHLSTPECISINIRDASVTPVQDEKLTNVDAGWSLQTPSPGILDGVDSNEVLRTPIGASEIFENVTSTNPAFSSESDSTSSVLFKIMRLGQGPRETLQKNSGISEAKRFKEGPFLWALASGSRNKNYLEPRQQLEYARVIVAVARCISNGKPIPQILVRKICLLLQLSDLEALVARSTYSLRELLANESGDGEEQAKQRAILLRRRRRMLKFFLHRGRDILERDLPYTVRKRMELELRFLRLRQFHASIASDLQASSGSPLLHENSSPFVQGAPIHEAEQAIKDDAVEIDGKPTYSNKFWVARTDPILAPANSNLSNKRTGALPPNKERGRGLVRLRIRRMVRGIPEHQRLLRAKWDGTREKAAEIAIGSRRLAEVLIVRQEQIREREMRERLRLLRANDMSGYMALIRQSKNERIQHLLSKTSEFMETIATRLPMQQRDALENKKHKRRPAKKGAKALQDNSTVIDGPLSQPFDEEFVEDSEGAASLELSVADVDQPATITGGMLLPYQLTGLQFLVGLYRRNLSGILADEMGLGKTVQTIAFLAFLREERIRELQLGLMRANGQTSMGGSPAVGFDKLGEKFWNRCPHPHLVIVPLSTLPNWVSEIERWCPSLQKLVFRGKTAKSELASLTWRTRKTGPSTAGRQKTTPEYGFDICLTTYEWVIRERRVLSEIAWSIIVVDEGHRMKNSRSKFHLILSHDFKSSHRLLLTGTPLQNNLNELWGLLHFVLPKIFDSSDDFEQWFQQPFRGAAEPKRNSLLVEEQDVALTEEESFLVINRLHAVLRPFLLRRVKKDVLTELPEKKDYLLRLPLTPWQKLIYDQLTARFLSTRNSSTVTKWADKKPETLSPRRSRRSGANQKNSSERGTSPVSISKALSLKKASMNNLVMQLRKVANHPYLFESDYSLDDLLWRSSSKFEVLDRILPKLLKFKHKILIFCQMTQLMDILDDYLEHQGIPRYRLDGSVGMEERRAQMDEFNDPANDKTLLFILSTRSGGLGVNLQAADTVIIFDSDWNPHQDRQAEARAHRMGQKHEVRVFRLVTTCAVEEAVLKKAQHKLDVDEKIIQAGMFNNKTSEAERQENLRKLLVLSSSNDEKTRVTTPAELNRFLARNEIEEEYFREYDKELMTPGVYHKFERCHGNVTDLLIQSKRFISNSEIPQSWTEADIEPNARDASLPLHRGSRRTRPTVFTELTSADEESSDGSNGAADGESEAFPSPSKSGGKKSNKRGKTLLPPQSNSSTPMENGDVSPAEADEQEILQLSRKRRRLQPKLEVSTAKRKPRKKGQRLIERSDERNSPQKRSKLVDRSDASNPEEDSPDKQPESKVVKNKRVRMQAQSSPKPRIKRGVYRNHRRSPEESEVDMGYKSNSDGTESSSASSRESSSPSDADRSDVVVERKRPSIGRRIFRPTARSSSRSGKKRSRS